MSTLLPSKFAALEPFVNSWAIAGAANRMKRRLESAEEDRVAFFNAAKDLVKPALDYLDQKPLGQFDDQEKRLMNLMLSFCHVLLAVEILGSEEPRHAEFARHMTITRATTDWNA
jgi:hypothetical protein